MLPNALVLDVRSPAEYEHAHIPGSQNLPLFSNEERKLIGTAYKQQSREIAVQIGIKYFSPKMAGFRAQMLQILKDSASAEDAPIIVHCWRGGMRSGTIAWLLSLYGTKIHVLEGGYKAYRSWALSQMEMPRQLRVLGGYTGSNKTGVLAELAAVGEPVLDLEGLAVHRGSAFGAMPTPQPSQEMFENTLALELDGLANKSFWVEDESQRIGLVNIPKSLWFQMREQPVYFLLTPFEERLKHIVQLYGDIDIAELAAATERIQKRLGPLETKTTLAHLEHGQLSNAFGILLHYYDRHYGKSLKNRSEDVQITEILCDDTDSKSIAKKLINL